MLGGFWKNRRKKSQLTRNSTIEPFFPKTLSSSGYESGTKKKCGVLCENFSSHCKDQHAKIREFLPFACHNFCSEGAFISFSLSLCVQGKESQKEKWFDSFIFHLTFFFCCLSVFCSLSPTSVSTDRPQKPIMPGWPNRWEPVHSIEAFHSSVCVCIVALFWMGSSVHFYFY